MHAFTLAPVVTPLAGHRRPRLRFAGISTASITIAAVALGFALPARGQIPPLGVSELFVRVDEVTERQIEAVNVLLTRQGFDPRSRSDIPESTLNLVKTIFGIETPNPPKLTLDQTLLQDSFNDFLARDTSAIITRLGPRSVAPPGSEPPRSALTNGSIVVVGQGRTTAGAPTQAVLSIGQVAAGGAGFSGPFVTNVITGFPADSTAQTLAGVAPDGSVAAGEYRLRATGATIPFFLNVPSGAPTPLPLAAGDRDGSAARISDDGAFIVGTTTQASTTGPSTSRVVRWTRSGSGYAITTIGNFPGLTDIRAWNISGDGNTIIGNFIDPAFRNRPFRWTQAGGFRDLGTLPGVTFGEALDLTPDGATIVGNSGHAVTWNATGTITALRTLTGSNNSSANAIGTNGALIGGVSYGTNFLNPLAVLWTKSGEVIKLKDFLSVMGVSVTGWVFQTVDRITRNADGSYNISGNGTFNGRPSSFMATLSAPAGPVGPPPSITTQPRAQAAAVGGTAVMSVAATDATGYQWRRNGTAIPGATNATLTIPNVQAANAGDYTVVVFNGASPVTSAAVTLTVAPTVSRLANVSVRTTAGSAANPLIVGFTLGGGGKNVLLRAVGPTLGTFGVPGTLDDPRLAVFTGAGAQTAQNDDWGGAAALTAAFDAVGAFRLPATSKDAVLLNPLPAGGYTAQVSGAAGTSGVVLLEAYDSDAGSPLARYTNLSARNQVGTGGNILIVGFNIVGNGPKNLLIRAVGPALTQFGVGGVLSDPQLAIFNAAGTETNRNDDWGGGAALAGAFTSVGAFGLPAASKDAALNVTLQPGSYTVQVSGVANTTGVALAEIYELP
jgi:uncharacterized membrane protein